MEEKKQHPQMQLQTTTVPMFSDVVMVRSEFSESPANAKFKKSTNVRISFADTSTQRIIGDFVISVSTAEALKNILENTINNADNFVKGKLQKKEEPKTTAPENQRYIG